MQNNKSPEMLEKECHTNVYREAQNPSDSHKPEISQNLSGLSKSAISKKSMLRIGVRTSNNPISKELLNLVFTLQILNKWNKTIIAEKIGLSRNYLSMLINNFDKYWPKTNAAQKRILSAIQKLRNDIPNKSKGEVENDN